MGKEQAGNTCNNRTRHSFTFHVNSWTQNCAFLFPSRTSSQCGHRGRRWTLTCEIVSSHRSASYLTAGRLHAALNMTVRRIAGCEHVSESAVTKRMHMLEVVYETFGIRSHTTSLQWCCARFLFGGSVFTRMPEPQEPAV